MATGPSVLQLVAVVRGLPVEQYYNPPSMEVKIVLELVELLNHAAHQDNVQGGFHTMRILLMIIVIRAYQEHSQEQA